MFLDKEQIKELEEITSTNYEFNEKGETKNWDIIVSELLVWYKDLLEEYNNYKEYVVDRYERRIDFE